MAVKKKIAPSVEEFIDKGAQVRAIKYSEFKNILIRIPVAILNKVDEHLAEKPWMNRTHYIVEAIYEKLMSDINGWRI